MQLANTPPLQSTTPGLHPVSFHQMAPPVRGNTHPITAYYSVYRPRKDERLSRPGWLVTYRNKGPPPGVEPGHVTHPSTNRARRRVTSLIRPTLLPLRHAANQDVDDWSKNLPCTKWMMNRWTKTCNSRVAGRTDGRTGLWLVCRYKITRRSLCVCVFWWNGDINVVMALRMYIT